MIFGMGCFASAGHSRMSKLRMNPMRTTADIPKQRANKMVGAVFMPANLCHTGTGVNAVGESLL